MHNWDQLPFSRFKLNTVTLTLSNPDWNAGVYQKSNVSQLTSSLKGTCSSSKEYGCSFECTTQNAAHQRRCTLSQSVTHKLCWSQFVDPGSLVAKTSRKVITDLARPSWINSQDLRLWLQKRKIVRKHKYRWLFRKREETSVCPKIHTTKQQRFTNMDGWWQLHYCRYESKSLSNSAPTC